MIGLRSRGTWGALLVMGGALIVCSCGSARPDPTADHPRPACIITHNRATGNKMRERVLIVGEVDAYRWLVLYRDREWQDAAFKQPFPLEKSSVSEVDCAQNVGFMEGLAPTPAPITPQK